MHALDKLIAKKKKEGKEMPEGHKKAKSSVLEELMDDMSGMGAEKVKGLKKVTVASNSPEGLEAGLSKAKQMIAKKEEPEMGESEEHEMGESEEEEAAEHEEESPEEIEAKIAELKAKLEQMKA